MDFLFSMLRYRVYRGYVYADVYTIKIQTINTFTNISLYRYNSYNIKPKNYITNQQIKLKTSTELKTFV